jgi:uncharacterized protein YjbI with pentapeptide repeats
MQSSDLKLYEVSVSEFLSILRNAEKKRLCIKEYLHEYVYDYNNKHLKYVLYVKGKIEDHKREAIRAYNFTDEDFTFSIFENIEFVHCNFIQSDMSFVILNNTTFTDCIRECYGEYIFRYGVKYEYQPNTDDKETNNSLNMQYHIYRLYKQHQAFTSVGIPEITLSKKTSEILYQPFYMRAIKSLYNFMMPKGVCLLLLGLSMYIGFIEGIYVGALFCGIIETFFLGTCYIVNKSLSGYEFDKSRIDSNDLNNNSKERQKEDQKRQKNKENSIGVN